jgi:glycosyltransferase involved in cell wall biosynthesis
MNHSLCILSFNRPEFLRECIETIISNSHKPIEIIVHDDGSKDEKVYDYLLDLQRNGKISLLMLSPRAYNQGQGIALNRMFHAAKGDVIWKVDQDLIFHKDWLAQAETILSANENIGLLGAFHYWLDPCDSKKTIIEQFDGWSSRTHILGSCFAVTRKCWEQVGPFTERSPAFSEDWHFQDMVTKSEDFVCALPDNDLVHNQGFGIGPSTVVNSTGAVEEIKMRQYEVS